MKKSKWINLPIFWKWGSILFLGAALAWFTLALFNGIDKIDLLPALMLFLISLVLQVQYMLFKYFEKKKIDARWW